MASQNKHRLIYLLVFVSTTVFAQPIFISQSGPKLVDPVLLNLCLNVNTKGNCQVITSSHATINIEETEHHQSYPNAGIKIIQDETKYTLDTEGSNCTENFKSGYCEFYIPAESDHSINVSSKTIALGEPRDGGRIALLSSSGAPKNLIISESLGTSDWSQVIDVAVPYPGAKDWDNGEQNSNAIIKQMIDADPSNVAGAAVLCEKLNHRLKGNTHRWYLQSSEESFYVFETQWDDKVDLGFKEDVYYWTSNEADWDDDIFGPPEYYAEVMGSFRVGDIRRIQGGFLEKNKREVEVRCVREFTV